MTTKQFEKLTRDATRIHECPECISFECDEIMFYAWNQNGYIVEYETDLILNKEQKKVLQVIINKTILKDERENRQDISESGYEVDQYEYNGVKREDFY